jgi:hypothetical protein
LWGGTSWSRILKICRRPKFQISALDGRTNQDKFRA